MQYESGAYRTVEDLFSLQARKKRQDKELCNKVRRDRMARQPDQGLVSGPPQDRGLAGLDGNAVQQELSERFDDAAGRVLHTGAAAAG